ncbi:DUF4139 domain-containing protein, partial [Jannaschia sp.]|nr:DUF4139 domain-containing protein [Jannaschia sp.]
MRLAVLLCVLPTLAASDDITLPAPVVAAEIFLQAAALTRVDETTLPAGEHRLLVPVTPSAWGLPRVTVDGAKLGATAQLQDALVDARTLYTEVQETAATALETAEAALAEAEDARIAAAAALAGAEARLGFLRSVSGGQLAQLDAARIGEAAETIGVGIVAAQTAQADARRVARASLEAVEGARLTVDQARRDLEATGAPQGPVTMLAIGVSGEGGPVTLTLEQMVGNAGWSPSYVADLTGETVTLERRAILRQGTGLALQDVTVRLSTADPSAATAPGPVFPDQVTTRGRGGPVSGRISADATESFARAAPAPEPVVIARVDTSGPVVAYAYPDPVTVPADGGAVTLVLDTLSFDAETFNRAVPRIDETAFLMAALTNEIGEPILPGPVALRREGARVGEAALPLIPAGDEAELAFGPQQHLRLEWRALQNEEGETGI